jgi:hypothetical protein
VTATGCRRATNGHGFKELIGHFHCTACQSYFYLSPRGNPDSLRCVCNAVNLNLSPKLKG